MYIVISAKALQKGMYIASKGQEPSADTQRLHAAQFADGYVYTDAERQALANGSAVEVRIDPGRTLLDFDAASVAASPAVIARQRHERYVQELEQAVALQEGGLAVAHDLESRVNRGEELPVQETKEIVRGMMASLSANRNVLLGLSRLKRWDEYTYTHSMNVALYATLLCKYMGGSDALAEEAGVSGFFHDIGKLFIPQEIINFPGKLNEEQFQLIRKHPQYGESYGQELSSLSTAVRRGILEHHEKYDGTGYPYGKKGAEISQIGAMLLVADIYDALSSRRSYKPPMSPGDALSCMYRERGNAYAPGMLESFIKAVGVYPPGCMVRLNDNSVAVVTEQTTSSLQPQVVVLLDGRGAPLNPPVLLDLSRNSKLVITNCGPPQPAGMDLQRAMVNAR